MYVWIAILIPVFTSIILMIFFRKQTHYLEYSLLLVPSALLVLLMNCIMISSNEDDTEYLGNYITKVIYYQAWNEKVSCRHPIYCTRTYPCGSGKNRHTCTSSYVCGHVHLFDVDFHPEHWTKKDNSGSEYGISNSEFAKLQSQFGTKTYLVKLNRNFYTINGGSYNTDWSGSSQTSEVITSTNSYVNKVRASHSVFKLENINEKEKIQWRLYEYPNVSNDMYQSLLLGYSADAITNRKLQYLNGFYGSSKQFRTYILFFKDQSMDVAYKQRSYWEGGNKNEFIICIGINKSGEYKWCKAFSWMDKPELEVVVEDYFSQQQTKYPDLNKFADWMPIQIEKHWRRKDFKDFEYLSVEVTSTQFMWILIIVGLYNIGMSVWVILNEFENE